MPRKPQEYSGQIFGNLTVIGEAPRRGTARYLICECVCGTCTEVHLSNLTKNVGGVRSCGCVNKHGGTGTRLHRIWQNMKQRCYNTNHNNYKHYGAIGVTICESWRNSFVHFREWAQASGYRDDLSIDRIAGALVYSAETCRWATQETQSRNQRARENTTSKYKGVCLFARTQKWIAYVTVGGKRIHIGYYTTQEEAARARDDYITSRNLPDFVLNGI